MTNPDEETPNEKKQEVERVRLLSKYVSEQSKHVLQLGISLSHNHPVLTDDEFL
jgi:hypothetical protein